METLLFWFVVLYLAGIAVFALSYRQMGLDERAGMAWLAFGWPLLFVGIAFLWYLSRLTTWLVGLSFFDLMMELVMVLTGALVLTVPFWTALAFGSAILRLRRIRFERVFIVVLLLVLIPHLVMTVRLRSLKLDFKETARSPHGEVFLGEPGQPGEFDYGGKLDDIVARRILTLIDHQYVPYFTCFWRYNGLVAMTGSAYLYTYLPKGVYDRVLASIAGVSLEEYNRQLGEVKKDLPGRPK